MATTIMEVARHAGVSASTVSYVLSGKRPISQPTRERVLASIAELDYHPHAGARALAGNRTQVIGLVMPVGSSGLHRPLLAEFMMAISVTARGYGHNVLLLTDQEGQRSVVDATRGGQVDGLVMMDVTLHDPRVETVRRLGIPTVLIGLPAEPGGLECVDLDFAAAGRLCVDHLADLGHREVVFVGQPEEVYRRQTGFAERTLTGVLDQARERGVRVTHRPCEGGWSATAGLLARVLAERPSVTALVVHNESAASHLAGVLRNCGRAVPEDVSVVAIGADAAAESGEPPLTSIAVPAQRLGTHAVQALMAHLEGPRRPAAPPGARPAPGPSPGAGAGPDGPGGPLLLRPELTVRASTGPARSAPPPRAPRHG
ncbi:LacI family DNA-binding transcriptional regulator [Allostreptomyces psammosilenae]|uniref:DNA-binding LacI/PurR family transcriptional regulator n=1 Tax=Allostreptomyces psammosilenae TaxID=1892865 RepID=A0A852ZZX8_9ACTN|nr:LacI family DNA-binding transcriptional regulator [Allostreptomyces psammosilenae]NYI07675.1 DNA-binding LacI/PurR family transcriptional regulator [Allostreptomyces psammosilenae]